MFDAAIGGAGIIGMTCALELHNRGLAVVVLERGTAAREASWAAGGMIAVRDVCNPLELSPLSELSERLYPTYLKQIRDLSGMEVPLETNWTLEQVTDDATQQNTLPALQGSGFHLLAEHSLDPRKLTSALLSALRAAGVTVLEGSAVESVKSESGSVTVRTATASIVSKSFLDCTGAWSGTPVRPAKGQMLRVHAPGALAKIDGGNVVVRTATTYLIPRLDGSVVVGATVEDAGYDRTVHAPALQHLRSAAAALLPALAEAPELESWSGLRPDTPDHLPLLGSTGENTFIAAGHFRNGVLLAPATSRVMSQLILGEKPEVDLAPFAPSRFGSESR